MAMQAKAHMDTMHDTELVFFYRIFHDFTVQELEKVKTITRTNCLFTRTD